jgi:alkylhydroperoxidase family enzyme
LNKQIVDLTVPIGQINLWNRLANGMRYVHDVDLASSGR